MKASKKKNKDVGNEVTHQQQDALIWDQFVKLVAAHIDPVLASILYATDFVSFDQHKKIVEVVTLKKFTLFQDLFFEQKKIYEEYLSRLFGYQATLIVHFTKIEKSAVVYHKNIAVTAQDSVTGQRPQMVHASSVMKPVRAPAYQGKPAYASAKQSYVACSDERFIDVSDTKKWQLTHMLLQKLGGTVREIIKDTTNEFNA